jgi:hypothetical protein
MPHTSAAVTWLRTAPLPAYSRAAHHIASGMVLVNPVMEALPPAGPQLGPDEGVSQPARHNLPPGHDTLLDREKALKRPKGIAVPG